MMKRTHSKVNTVRLLLGPQLTMFLGGMLTLLACFGTRLGVWEFSVGIVGLGLSMPLFIFSSLWAGKVLLFRWQQPSLRRGDLFGLIAFNLLIVGWMGHYVMLAIQSPPLVDITTDLQDPPAYLAAATLRRADQHPVGYAGGSSAELQQRLYPDIQPINTLKGRERVYKEMRKLIEERDWEITYEDPDGGHLEAVATSFWLGFKDDIVVRILPRGPSSVLDIRSSSRLGQSDLGVNAQRVRQLIADFRAREIEIDADFQERIRQRSGTGQ